MRPELEQISEGYREALAGRSAGWCQLHPQDDERRWGAQQVVEHVALALRSSARVVESRLERGRPTRQKSTLVQRIVRLVVLRIGRLPHGVPAPPFVRPGLLHWPAMNGQELAAALRAELEAVDALLDACEQRFREHPAAAHFLLGPLSAAEWRKFHAIHCRHHLKQLERIAAALGDDASAGAEEQAGAGVRAGL